MLPTCRPMVQYTLGLSFLSTLNILRALPPGYKTGLLRHTTTSILQEEIEKLFWRHTLNIKYVHSVSSNDTGCLSTAHNETATAYQHTYSYILTSLCYHRHISSRYVYTHGVHISPTPRHSCHVRERFNPLRNAPCRVRWLGTMIYELFGVKSDQVTLRWRHYIGL